MKKPTLTIGIPAYNEEHNIAELLKSVLKQSQKTFILREIIVSSDGSSDLTVKRAKSVRSIKIKVIENRDRKGIARGLKQVASSSKSDILVTLDADIAIKDKYFIKKLISPILNFESDLTSSSIVEKFPSTFYGKVIYISMALKNNLFSTFRFGNNVYTCHGLARAYSKRFYKKLKFPVSIGNDMYCYLKCISLKYKYTYAEDAIAWYNLPQNHSDHQKQSTRFFTTLKDQRKYFTKKLIEKEIHIPKKTYLKAAIKSLPLIIRFPIYSLAYVLIQAYMRAVSLISKQSDAWTIATSTKKYE